MTSLTTPLSSAVETYPGRDVVELAVPTRALETSLNDLSLDLCTLSIDSSEVPTGSRSPSPTDIKPSSPSEAYIQQARVASRELDNDARSKNNYLPPLLILDLNETLCYRKRKKSGIASVRPRPYLSSFLRYVCGKEQLEGVHKKRFTVIVSNLRKHARHLRAG